MRASIPHASVTYGRVASRLCIESVKGWHAKRAKKSSHRTPTLDAA